MNLLNFKAKPHACIGMPDAQIGMPDAQLGMPDTQKGSAKLLNYEPRLPDSILRRREKSRNWKIVLISASIAVLGFCFAPQIIKTFNYKEKNSHQRAEEILLKADEKYLPSDCNSRIAAYEQVLEIEPNNARANAELAIMYFLQNDLMKANKFLRATHSQEPKNLYVQAAQGMLYLKQGKYIKSQEILQRAYNQGLRQSWLINALGSSLLANQKNDEAFDLAGWNGDCQSNTVSHAFCMKRLAEWHGEISETEYKLAKKTNEKKRLEDGIYHQRRQLIFLGECLRSFFRAIEENDGKFRLALIGFYEEEKEKLTDVHARYMLISRIHAEKLKDTQLTKSERKKIPE